MSEQFEKPPVWWKDVLHTAWRELARANKGNRRLARKVKALERQLGEAAEEISGLSRACTAQFETITGLGLQLTTLRQSLQRAEGERVGYKRFVDNGIRVFMNPCEKHSGENTPPLPEFLEKYGDKCIPCLVDELAGFRKPLTASDGGES
jgi:regulator of replication initiation timing